MRLLAENVLDKFARRHPESFKPLSRWKALILGRDWTNFVELRATFRSADQVKLSPSRVVVTIFDIGGNKYRLVTQVLYESGLVVVLSVLTHAEYSRGRWKERLQ